MLLESSILMTNVVIFIIGRFERDALPHEAFLYHPACVIFVELRIFVRILAAEPRRMSQVVSRVVHRLERNGVRSPVERRLHFPRCILLIEI